MFLIDSGQAEGADFISGVCQLVSVDHFTASRIASAVLATTIPSIRLSVRSSHAGIVPKRRNVARCSLHSQIAKCV